MKDGKRENTLSSRLSWLRITSFRFHLISQFMTKYFVVQDFNRLKKCVAALS